MRSIFARDDTLFGVCEALAEDLGFKSNFLRLALAVGLFWNPFATIGLYAGLGMLVAVTRWLVPEPAVEVAAEPSLPAEAEEQQWEFFAEAA